MKNIPAPPQDFDTYIARPETRWIEREPGESLATIYDNGFLPYSGARGTRNVFYSARSARIVLPQFELTSENRRIAKKFDGQFTKERVPKTAFVPDEAFYTFCLSYFAQKHGERTMPRERLETILSGSLVTKTTIYRSLSKPVAYVLEVEDSAMAHYWFSFYDPALAGQSLGLWLMLDALRDAKERGLQYYYLGTVYGEKALYKTNFGPLEWWDGSVWNKNTALLKELGRKE
jgi:arginyl-tRNA--protein-N-Asp/Glu arginylyltransferase